MYDEDDRWSLAGIHGRERERVQFLLLLRQRQWRWASVTRMAPLLSLEAYECCCDRESVSGK